MDTVRSRDDSGFTVVEAMVAVAILAIAISLSIQPVLSTLGFINQSQIVSTAENLAQTEIEQIRAIGYDDVGLPGFTPSGVLTPSKTVVVEGRTYTIDVSVTYAGSVTGLNVVSGGGDGVPGVWDPGVDYKYVEVTVTPQDRTYDPIVMQTIVAPPTVGAHETIANIRVLVAAFEPIGGSSTVALPSLKLTSLTNPTVKSHTRTGTQVFPAIPEGVYSVELDIADDWQIVPEDVLGGATSVIATASTTADAVVRVFLPAQLTLEIVDADTGLPVVPNSVTLTRVATGDETNLTGGTLVATGLVPDIYDVLVSAGGYESAALTSVQIPSEYPTVTDTLRVELTPFVGTFGLVDLLVRDPEGNAINGAVVTALDPISGL